MDSSDTGRWRAIDRMQQRGELEGCRLFSCRKHGGVWWLCWSWEPSQRDQQGTGAAPSHLKKEWWMSLPRCLSLTWKFSTVRSQESGLIRVRLSSFPFPYSKYECSAYYHELLAPRKVLIEVVCLIYGKDKNSMQFWLFPSSRRLSETRTPHSQRFINICWELSLGMLGCRGTISNDAARNINTQVKTVPPDPEMSSASPLIMYSPLPYANKD
jgi:hypothetical protein